MFEKRAKERLPVIVFFLLFMECLSSWLDYIEAFLQRKGKYTYFKNNPVLLERSPPATPRATNNSFYILVHQDDNIPHYIVKRKAHESKCRAIPEHSNNIYFLTNVSSQIVTT